MKAAKEQIWPTIRALVCFFTGHPFGGKCESKAQLKKSHPRNPINIFGEPYEVRAQIGSIDAFSGHADANELKAYVQAMTGDIKKVLVIHGEESQGMAFAQTLRGLKPKAEVIVPEYGQVVEI